MVRLNSHWASRKSNTSHAYVGNAERIGKVDAHVVLKSGRRQRNMA